MFCRDKKLIINGKAVLSPEQQIYENMKQIKALRSYIKPCFTTSSELTDESTGDLVENTNVGDAKEGYLMTEDGLLFKIDDNDGTSLLLTFLSNFQGPQGIQGEQGPQGIQGEQGVQGETGATPVITVTASVGNTTGTPSVTVTKTGTAENPSFLFAFTNLKGDKGDTGTSLISVQVVENLPASGDTGTLYFVPNNSGQSQNAYDEYIYCNNAWEKLGEATIDLSNYIQKSNTTGLVKNDGTIDTNTYLPSSSFLIENIKDSDGHNRFVEGNISTSAITGVTFNYAKWSLSGTHLMFVLAGTIEDGTSLSLDQQLGIVGSSGIPYWIYNKLVALTTDGSGLDIKSCPFFTQAWVSPAYHQFRIQKLYGNIVIVCNENFTNSSNRAFRIQFDFLVDN